MTFVWVVGTAWLEKSPWPSPFKIGTQGNSPKGCASSRTYFNKKEELKAMLSDINCKKLRCRCSRNQACHTDSIIEALEGGETCTKDGGD